ANHIILRCPSSSPPVGRGLLPSASAAACSPLPTMGGVLLRALLFYSWGGSRRQRMVCISEPPESPPTADDHILCGACNGVRLGWAMVFDDLPAVGDVLVELPTSHV
ncbi:prolipoprotein diacylglyceryl transferase, partial [Striga asiatica]